MRAWELVQGISFELICGDIETFVSDITDDSRCVRPGCVFICISGDVHNGHDYIEDALARGAVGVIVSESLSRDMILSLRHRDCFAIFVYDIKACIGRLCNNFFDWPSRRLKLVGVTGTKGKTTTACMIRHMLDSCNYGCGLIGTLGIDTGSGIVSTQNTTPSCVTIHKALAEMVKNGLSYCVMEVSSQGIMKNRIAGIIFDTGVFTNISYDHVGKNEHKTFEEYYRWKSHLITKCKNAVICSDDIYLAGLVAGIKDTGLYERELSSGKACDRKASLLTYGLSSGDVMAVNPQSIVSGEKGGMSFILRFDSKMMSTINVDLPGICNVENALAAISVSLIYGLTAETMSASLRDVVVPGRMEYVHVSDKFMVVIDYAHNSISLINALSTLRRYTAGKIICVFGCGGNRARHRRFGMGKASGLYADVTVITSDNPRYEAPIEIMHDIKTGVEKTCGSYVMIEDRKEAIRYALSHAQEGDIVLLAGKGHETYQEICGRRLPMNERELIAHILKEDKDGVICGCNN